MYCVCLSQWQPVYHVDINLSTITLWCPGWRPQTGVSLTPAHFVSWLRLCPFLLTLPRPLLLAKILVCRGCDMLHFNIKKWISGLFGDINMTSVDCRVLLWPEAPVLSENSGQIFQIKMSSLSWLVYFSADLILPNLTLGALGCVSFFSVFFFFCLYNCVLF